MDKKTKLTISGTTKKSIKNIEIAKTHGKNSVIIEQHQKKFSNRTGTSKPKGTKSKPFTMGAKNNQFKPSFNPKASNLVNDFEKRKLAEQRATKRLKEKLRLKTKSLSKVQKKRAKINCF